VHDADPVLVAEVSHRAAEIVGPLLASVDQHPVGAGVPPDQRKPRESPARSQVEARGVCRQELPPQELE
jgi:hypothetical protein